MKSATARPSVPSGSTPSASSDMRGIRRLRSSAAADVGSMRARAAIFASTFGVVIARSTTNTSPSRFGSKSSRTPPTIAISE